jgi:hypothetical protein
MHPYLAESLGRERLEYLRREAEKSRLAASAVASAQASEHPGRIRVLLGAGLVRLGLRLAGPDTVLVARLGE